MEDAVETGVVYRVSSANAGFGAYSAAYTVFLGGGRGSRAPPPPAGGAGRRRREYAGCRFGVGQKAGAATPPAETPPSGMQR